uniref:Putative ecdysteroid kinase n=1 Tax=Nyssomyia neivai TaxID=330878 RepID=A0A1L8DYJ0_9DIPT
MATDSEAPKYNKDELTPPDFLNEEYFRKVLQKDENDEALTITDFKMIPGTKPGDHFASIMFKAIISYTTKGRKVLERSLVVKTMPIEDGLKKDLLNEMPIFEREIKMYTKVLPEMKRIMESIGDFENIAPRLIYHNAEPPVVIFEDISKAGFSMHADLFNFENTVKILKKLAKFHALSFYINDNKYSNNLNLPECTGIFLNEKSIGKLQVFFAGLGVLKNIMKEWPGYEEIVEKIDKLIPKFTQKLLDVYKPTPEPGFNVLCHGDFHLRNMMFKMNGQDINETTFLDFQLCFWAPPAIDLFYVLYLLGNVEVRDRQNEVLMIYHTELTDYLSRLGCLRQGPSLLDLNIDMLKLGNMEILLGMCFLPAFCLDPADMDLEALGDPSAESIDTYYNMVYKNPKIVEILKKIINSLALKGMLD